MKPEFIVTTIYDNFMFVTNENFLSKKLDYNTCFINTLYVNLHRGVEQLVARRAHNPKVAGSSPVPATKKTFQP